MIELLTTFSPMTIVLCCIMIFLALRGIIEYRNWIKTVTDEAYEKRKKQEERDQRVEKMVADYNKELINISQAIEYIKKSLTKLDSQVDNLTKSDKDDIKAYITHQYHYFVDSKGWIDDYSMDCIEKRYDMYKTYKGNTFIDDLMEQLRALPRNYDDRIIK